MNPDSIYETWIAQEFDLVWSLLDESAKAHYRELYRQMHPVLQVAPTYSERLLTLLSGALEYGFASNRVDAVHSIRQAMGLVRTHDLIELHKAHGKIKVIESGRDCDSVEYSGLMRTCDATLEAFEELHDSISEYADGPFHLAIVPWTTEVEYETRDLVLEAHENGHPHHIVSRFP